MVNEYWNNSVYYRRSARFSDGQGMSWLPTFYTFIEFFAFYQLRQEGVTTQKIIKAHQVLSNTFETKYPFAKSNVSRMDDMFFSQAKSVK
jgi:hypothetical protein